MAEVFPSVPPSRRAVIRTALWSVPAISLATATPAFAISGVPALEFVGGSTRIDRGTGDLVFDGAAVRAVGRSTTAAPVLMTVTFNNYFGSRPILEERTALSGWSSSPSGNTLEFSSETNVRAGDPVSLGTGSVGRDRLADGEYILDFVAAGYEPVRASFIIALG